MLENYRIFCCYCVKYILKPLVLLNYQQKRNIFFYLYFYFYLLKLLSIFILFLIFYFYFYFYLLLLNFYLILYLYFYFYFYLSLCLSYYLSFDLSIVFLIFPKGVLNGLHPIDILN